MTEDKKKSSVYNEAYFMDGVRSGVSNYENYTWVGEATLPLASSMKKLLCMNHGDNVLDVGASRGFLVKAFRILGLRAFGFDISEWAVENCDPEVSEYMRTSYDNAPMSYDFITAKDVFEHIEPDLLEAMMMDFSRMMKKSMLIIVPLTGIDGGKYLCPRDEMDSTHVNRWTLPTWIKFLENIDRRLVVSGGYYVPGIKQANSSWEHSCGIITIRRI